ncbi:hypothetical protein GCG54_00003913 [Colletotrichum gloeosporioides]|uniref:Major facilitator superfamily transporter n=1 Tax=Colletotrichum gloeosporioides TaxID=474922 RepID=A0A8H4C5Y0_COLGL|nr:uncharacterized protein GCG54_00003913 [Colletotrichum gloeosporioides]KAF3798011.1 hypothetical protein GCG54_00003913 [Colletotrichum gloeosporioides]
MCGWAIVSAFTAMADNYVHLLVLRLLLGWFKAPFYPGAIYLLSPFYTNSELATHLAILYCGQLSAFPGPTNTGIFAGLDTMAIVNFSAVAANIYTAYLGPDSESPRFLVGIGNSTGFCVMCMLSAHFIWFLFRRLHRQQLRAPDGDSVKLFAT